MYLLRPRAIEFLNWQEDIQALIFPQPLFPSVKEHFRKVGMLEDNKCILLLDICGDACCWEFELRSGNIPSSNCDAPDTTYGPRSNTKCEVLLSVRFSFANVNREGTLKDLSTHLHYQKCSFQLCLCMEFSEGKNCSSSQEETVASCLTAKSASKKTSRDLMFAAESS